MNEQGLFDVVAVSLRTSKVRLMATGKTKDNAEAIVSMAVFRRGCEEEFFSECPAGKYRDGDKWDGKPKLNHGPREVLN